MEFTFNSIKCTKKQRRSKFLLKWRREDIDYIKKKLNYPTVFSRMNKQMNEWVCQADSCLS